VIAWSGFSDASDRPSLPAPIVTCSVYVPGQTLTLSPADAAVTAAWIDGYPSLAQAPTRSSLANALAVRPSATSTSALTLISSRFTMFSPLSLERSGRPLAREPSEYRPTKNVEPTDPRANRFDAGESISPSRGFQEVPRQKFAICEQNRFPLHLATARERAAERDLVGVLEVAADREAAGEPRHADAPAQPVGEVGGGCLAGHVRVRGQHDLLDAVSLHAAEQLVDSQMRGLDAVNRRECAAEHVIEAAVLGRALDRDQVGRLLDDADQRVVAPC